jgi:hypothetical protein
MADLLISPKAHTFYLTATLTKIMKQNGCGICFGDESIQRFGKSTGKSIYNSSSYKQTIKYLKKIENAFIL